VAIFPVLLVRTHKQRLVEPEDINSQAAFPRQLLPPSQMAVKLLTRIKNRQTFCWSELCLTESGSPSRLPLQPHKRVVPAWLKRRHGNGNRQRGGDGLFIADPAADRNALCTEALRSRWSATAQVTRGHAARGAPGEEPFSAAVSRCRGLVLVLPQGLLYFFLFFFFSFVS